MSKDVLYIEKDAMSPYMCFGSRLVKNVIQNHCGDLIVEGMGITIDNSNRCCAYDNRLHEILDLVERVGIVGVEWTHSQFFFSSEDFKEWIK
jgi:hypothetical protein